MSAYLGLSGDYLTAIVYFGVIEGGFIQYTGFDQLPCQWHVFFQLVDHVLGGITDTVEPFVPPELGLVTEKATPTADSKDIAFITRGSNGKDVFQFLRGGGFQVTHLTVG